MQATALQASPRPPCQRLYLGERYRRFFNISSMHLVDVANLAKSHQVSWIKAPCSIFGPRYDVVDMKPATSFRTYEAGEIISAFYVCREYVECPTLCLFRISDPNIRVKAASSARSLRDGNPLRPRPLFLKTTTRFGVAINKRCAPSHHLSTAITHASIESADLSGRCLSPRSDYKSPESAKKWAFLSFRSCRSAGFLSGDSKQAPTRLCMPRGKLGRSRDGHPAALTNTLPPSSIVHFGWGYCRQFSELGSRRHINHPLRASRCWSMMRRITSDTEMPSRSASALRKETWGSVKETMCLCIAIITTYNTYSVSTSIVLTHQAGF
jgi:hypothetical protein